MPRITVITPVRNGARFIESCIASVQEQGYDNLEHLIVDGASEDGTAEIVARLAGRHRHIRWLSEPDSGQSQAMNKGIARASGEIIGMLNVDDFYDPGVLRQVGEMFGSLPEPSLAVGNCRVWNDEGNLLYECRPRKLKLAQLLAGPRLNLYPVNPSQYFYHRSLHDVAGLFDEQDHFAMDLDFLLRAVQYAHVVYVDRNWGNFRLIRGTKTYEDSRASGNVARYREVLERYRPNLPGHIRRFFWLYRAGQALDLVARRLRGGRREPPAPAG